MRHRHMVGWDRLPRWQPAMRVVWHLWSRRHGGGAAGSGTGGNPTPKWKLTTSTPFSIRHEPPDPCIRRRRTSAHLHMLFSSSSAQQSTLNKPLQAYSTTKQPLPNQNHNTQTIKMQFTIATVLSLLTVALAAPAVIERQVPYIPCSGLYSNAQCCATDVLGVADLDCANRELFLSDKHQLALRRPNPDTSVLTATETVTSAANFQSTCAAIGQRARCCVLPVVSTYPESCSRQSFEGITWC